MAHASRGFFSEAIYRLSWPLRFLRAICFWSGLTLWLTIAASVFVAGSWWLSLPDFSKDGFAKAKKAAVVRIQSKIQDPQKWASFSWVDIDAINRDVLYAVVYAEDGQFFEHSGVDVDAMLDAFAENVKRRKILYGASTITQQVAKNLFLPNERALSRKFKELVLTKSLERHLSKNKILELYFNLAEFGPDIYGIAAASEYYFKKKPKDLHAGEGAFLAVLLPSPRKYHYSIFENGVLAPRHRAKIARVLADMRENELISTKQFKNYLKHPYVSRAPAGN